MSELLSFKKFQKRLKDSTLGILTNQSAYGGKFKNSYHFQEISKKYNLKLIFLPEHGLFAELQDQVSGNQLKYSYSGLEIVNLYGDNEDSLFIPFHYLDELDTILIDIRDVGSRYYTFLTTAFYMMGRVSEYNKDRKRNINFLVIDSPNPIGKKVEGSPLQLGFESFVGVRGVLHRHGLTPGQLLSYYNEEFHLHLDLSILPVGEFYKTTGSSTQWIPPSPNIPTEDTCFVYPGQCLLEGTNLSEGRGTTKPFEFFGAPFLNIEDRLLLSQIKNIEDSSFALRPLYFQPTFHKHRDQICGGFHIMIRNKKQFKSLRTTLRILKLLKHFYKEFEFIKGPYEFRSDKPAIELLVGDEFLLKYLNSEVSDRSMDEYLSDSEKVWKKKIEKYLY